MNNQRNVQTGLIKNAEPISDREFALFQRLIHQDAGIFLSDAKKPLLVSRLSRRLRELGISSFGDYYRRIADGDAHERINLIDSICTNETHFFREPLQFRFLEQQVFPHWIAEADAGRMTRRIRVWSAACSTGEEPFSIAMSLLTHFPPSSGWDVQVLATDLSTRALAKAQAATWRIDKAGEIPPVHLRRFMLKGTGAKHGTMKAGAEIRAIVRFQHLNLNDEVYDVRGKFHLVFCRNVLIYFKPELKARVIERLLDRLDPDGYLLLGHAESLNGLSDRARSEFATVYSHVTPRDLSSNARSVA
jgi:chemotaxis protein methyltransferase CheR